MQCLARSRLGVDLVVDLDLVVDFVGDGDMNVAGKH
jgi:hypothetical protein